MPLAFTVVELLVVVAILGILAALIFPALGGAKQKAQQAQCANNLRQLGIAQAQFVSDHHGYPYWTQVRNPPGDYPNPKEGWLDAFGAYANVVCWNTNRQPYQTAGLFHCPAARPPASPPWPKNVSFSDYGYNAYGITLQLFDTNGSLGLSRLLVTRRDGGPFDVSGSDVHQPVRETEVVNPSEMLAIGDGFTGNSQVLVDGRLTFGLRFDVVELVGSTRRVYRRHAGKGEVVFCDGHVEALTLDSLFTEKNDEVLRRWNRDHQPHRERVAP
jgi:prepilin-type processing-associated H-X9-DG protein